LDSIRALVFIICWVLNQCVLLRPFCTIFFGEVYADLDGGTDIQYQRVGGPAVLDSLSFTVENVQKHLQGLDASKGFGLNGIPPRILKSCSDGSLSKGVFPESWKRSYVVPIFKNGKHNYRGIAILSAMPKWFFDSLFFNLKSSIAVVQHGFLKAGQQF
jgi:hypothetical protein